MNIKDNLSSIKLITEVNPMSLIEINRHPEPKELRNFGLIALIASIGLSLLLYILKGLLFRWILVIIGIGFIIFLCSRISVRITRVIFLGLMLATMPVGWLVSFILLAIFYYLILAPIGLIFRLTGRDMLQRKYDAKANSYWLKRSQPDTAERYFHQF
jgi:hypothetical protein